MPTFYSDFVCLCWNWVESNHLLRLKQNHPLLWQRVEFVSKVLEIWLQKKKKQTQSLWGADWKCLVLALIPAGAPGIPGVLCELLQQRGCLGAVSQTRTHGVCALMWSPLMAPVGANQSREHCGGSPFPPTLPNYFLWNLGLSRTAHTLSVA